MIFSKSNFEGSKSSPKSLNSLSIGNKLTISSPLSITNGKKKNILEKPVSEKALAPYSCSFL